MNFKSLGDPFPESDISWRVQSSGFSDKGPYAMVLAYVTNRAIQDRLDDVCGPQNWRNEYTPGPNGGVLCGISIKVGDEWVTKWDGADNTNIEAVKGGLSDAMKRAAVQWGIGRYLYHLKEGWARFDDNGEYKSEIKDRDSGRSKWLRWNPPSLPPEALPQGEQPEPSPKKQQPDREPPTEAPPEKKKGDITPAQMGKIFATARDLGWSDDETKSNIVGDFQGRGIDELSKKDASGYIKYLLEEVEKAKAQSRGPLPDDRSIPF